jgi:predicted protein tyrosine phosphatase
VLFVCGKNRRSSPTAETIFSTEPGLHVSSAGISADAECTVSRDLIEWADTIVVMEQRHARRLRERFGQSLECKRLVSLGIPDRYEAIDAELIGQLRRMAALWRREA